MKKTLTIGFSPCPNDTFIFYALVHKKIPLGEITFAPPLLEDVETLNIWAMNSKLDVTKLSFHAFGHVMDDYAMLMAGAALGRGCGPLLVTKDGEDLDPDLDCIAIPGKYTTAAMLLKLYAPRCRNMQVMRFEKIMPAVAEGSVAGGVIIHESRFTYRAMGLRCVQDLGAWWEEETGLPIPLGCIVARKDFAASLRQEIDKAVRDSLLWARENPGQCMPYITKHAQEMPGQVLTSHINLYVNDFSLNLGEEGKRAVREFLQRGVEAGVFPDKRGIDLQQL